MKSQSKLANLFSVKLLFIFSLVFLFSFSQINYSEAVCGDDFSICTPEEVAEANLRALEEETARKAAAAANIDPCKGTGVISGIPCEMWLVMSRFALQVSAELTNLSGKLFDFTTQKFVLQISTMFKDGAGADKAYIYGGWSIIRDLANIAAFFGAVYTGFRYITGSDSLDFKKAVTKLILYSILVNFSFPIAKFLIDISNVISLQIYGGISEYKIGDNVLSRNLLSAMNLNSLVSQVGAANPDFKGFSSFSLMWLAIIYLLSAFAVFLYAALMILVRSFILLACVILSPLMFLNFAFPKLTELHEKWRENFFGQLIFAPVLMFGFWLSFILLKAATLTPLVAGAVVPSYSDVTQLINMLLAILSLFLTVKMASSVAGGAGKAISGFVGGGMKNLGLAAATGGTGMAFRQTVGRAGAAMANSNWVKNTGKENGATRRMAASLASGAGNKMSSYKLAGTKSFDEKRSGNVKEDKANFQSENSDKLKKYGMGDLMNQASTPEELKQAKEELEKRANDPSYKHNDDIYGKRSKQKSLELNQSTLKEARLGNVSGANRKEFIALKNSGTKEESPEAKKLREEKIESLKNTSKVAAASNAVGGFMGDMARDVKGVLLENPLSQGVGNYAVGVKDRTVGMLNDIGEKLDSPSIIETIGRGVADGFRGKRSSSQSVATEGGAAAQTSAQAIEPKQTVATNTVTGASSRG